MALGIAEALAWFFQCLPLLSNFDWNVMATFCINFGPPRYAWVGIGIFFDIIITVVPMTLLTKMMLKSFERKVLIIMFSANLLGTIVLTIGIYGIWITSNIVSFPDYTWMEITYITLQNLEVLAYTLGASAPVFTRFFVSSNSARSQGSSRRWAFWTERSSDSSAQDGSAPSSYRSQRDRSLPTYNPPMVDEGGNEKLGFVSRPANEEIERERKGSIWKALPREPPHAI